MDSMGNVIGVGIVESGMDGLIPARVTNTVKPNKNGILFTWLTRAVFRVPVQPIPSCLSHLCLAPCVTCCGGYLDQLSRRVFPSPGQVQVVVVMCAIGDS